MTIVCRLFFVAIFVAGAALAAEPEIVEVYVPLASRGQVGALEGAGFVVGNVTADRATVYLLREDLPRLTALGFAYEEAPPALQEKDFSGYHSYATLTAELQAYVNAYPEIASLESLGKSVQNRDLWAIQITDNPGVEEEEPEFKYVSTMHGDEPLGTELLLRLVDYLLKGYGPDPRATAIVNNTDLWIVPLMNPDGLNSSRRFNANNKDLNRTFPTFQETPGTLFDGVAPALAGREPENRAVMTWSLLNSFVLSANFHTGALVVNYLYDDAEGASSGDYVSCPDDALVRVLSKRYADLNPPMLDSRQFPGGTTNGAEWYVASGSMQDWNYRYLGCIEATIELSDIKKPATSALGALWDDNREAMLAYLEAVHWGVRGMVTDRATGEPVYARIAVEGNEQPVFSDASYGDYYRLLLQGVYALEIEAPGYISYRAANVQVPNGGNTRLDVALSDGDINADGQVNASDIQGTVNALLRRPGAPDADVDGLGMSATDLQAVINKALVR